MRSRLATIAALALAWTPAWAGDPFETTCLAPADVSLYVCVEDAAGLRAELRGRPLAAWLASWLSRGQVPGAWHRLAERAGLDPAAMLDAWAGDRVTVVARRGGELEWVVISEMDPDAGARLLDRLEPRVLPPQRDLALFALPRHELVLGLSGRYLLVAPRGAALFGEVAANVTGMASASTLAGAEAIATARRMGSGRVGVVVRHEAPMGGWSVAVGDLDGGRIGLRHEARFEHAPFRSVVTRLAWDPAPLARLEPAVMLGVVEPTDITGGPQAAWLETLLGEALLSRALRDRMGPRQLTAVADVDGRLEDPPFDAMLPTVARAVEVTNAAGALADLDRHMVRIAAAIERVGGGAFEVNVPDAAAFAAGAPRSIDLGPAARWVLGEVPGAGHVSLNWTVVDGASDRWCVVASHPAQLRAVAEALAGPAGDGGASGRWTSCGTADGRRLGAHVRAWAAQPGLLAAAGDTASLTATLDLISGLGDGVDRCRWRLARPDAQRMTLEADLELSPPESGR